MILIRLLMIGVFILPVFSCAAEAPVVYVKYQYTLENEDFIKPIKYGCDVLKKLKSPLAKPLVVNGDVGDLYRHVKEEYYSHDGLYFASYEKGHRVISDGPCTINIVKYQEHNFSDHNQFVAYKYTIVDTEKEEWLKKKLPSRKVASAIVKGLGGAAGITGKSVGKKKVAKLTCHIHQIDQSDMRFCEWLNDGRETQAKELHSLVLERIWNMPGGATSSTVATEVNLNMGVNRALLMPPAEVRKFPLGTFTKSAKDKPKNNRSVTKHPVRNTR